MSDMAKNLILWVIIAVVLMSVFNGFKTHPQNSQKINYSDFITEVRQGSVERVEIDGQKISGRLSSGEQFMTYSPELDNSTMVSDLLEHKVTVVGKEPERQSLLMQIFISWFHFLLLIGVWIFFKRQMQ